MMQETVTQVLTRPEKITLTTLDKLEHSLKLTAMMIWPGSIQRLEKTQTQFQTKIIKMGP